MRDLPDHSGGVTAEFPAELSSPARARDFVRGSLEGKAGPETVEAAVLMVSELVANAVLHAHSTVEAALSVDDQVTVAVSDSSHTLPVRSGDSGFGERGRGLVIVEQMSKAWGVEPGPAGKTVWFTLNRFP